MMYIKNIAAVGLLGLVAFGFALMPAPEETQASCTQVVREDVWYSGTTDSGVLNERLYQPIDCAIWAQENGVLYWNESVTNRPWEYDPYETVCLGITNPTGDVAKPPVRPALASAGQPVEVLYRSGNVCPAVVVTASLVANPSAVIRGEQSLLTWASTGATSCTGSGFSTGGATSGSVSVSPQQTTNYTVTCTGLGGQATAAAQVTVADGSLQVSCRAHPSQAAIGEDVLWSSTVTGPAGAYTYAWSGTDGLSGTLTQVFKQYQTTGSKNASLVVSVVPAQGASESKTVACENSVSIVSGGGGGGGGSQCSDGIDNDGDGNVDLADQGCSGSGDDSEATTSTATAQCSDGIDNNGDGNVDFPEDLGCSSLTDNLELLEPATLTFSAAPPLIKKNQSCTLTLSALNVSSCSLTGPGVSRGYTAQNGIISLKEVVTPELSQTSTYKLSCSSLDGKTVTKSVDCKIAPTFQEI